MSASDLDAARFGVALDIPIDPEGTIAVTPTGDVPMLSGRSCLLRDVQRRLVTMPGALIHRPTFGAGAVGYIGVANSAANQSRLANAARRNLLADARLKEVKIAITADGSTATLTATLTTQDDSKNVLAVTL